MLERNGENGNAICKVMKYDYIRPTIALIIFCIGLIYFGWMYLSSILSLPNRVSYLIFLPFTIALVFSFVLFAFDITKLKLQNIIKVYLPILVFGIGLNVLYLTLSASYFSSQGYKKISSKNHSSMIIQKWEKMEIKGDSINRLKGMVKASPSFLK